MTALLAVPAATAQAQSEYPNKPIQMLLGFAAGGVTDLFARLLSTQLSDQLGISVVVQNKAGANGNIAHEQVAKASADGYTLLFNTSSVILNPSLGVSQKFVDAFSELSPVSLVGTTPFVLFTAPSLPGTTIRDFVAHAKANAGKLSYASGGVGNMTHIGNLLFQQKMGIVATHVPYKGGNPAMAATVAQDVQFCMDTINSALAVIQSKRVKALAVTSMKRVAVIPDVPTMDETILPGFEVGSWYGMMTTGKTPAAVVRRINAEIVKALQDRSLVQKLSDISTDVKTSTPEQYGAFVKSEFESWAQLIKGSGIRVD